MTDYPEWGFYAYGRTSRPQLIFIDGEIITHVYHPTDNEIKQACTEHGLEFDELRKLIQEAIASDNTVHTIMIDLPVYKASQSEH